MKKKIASILVAILTFAMLGSGCAYRENQFVYGDFICQMGAKKSAVNIAGLSEEGKLKEVVVIPEEINGLSVKEIVDRSYYFESGSFESDCLERIYIPNSISYIYRGLLHNGCPNVKAVIYSRLKQPFMYNVKIQSQHCNDAVFYVPHISANEISVERDGFEYANVTFLYNFQGSSNGDIYWIDYCVYGEEIEMEPPIPRREGYDFSGWYKEVECVTPWDFENDALPQEQRTEDGLLIYQETKLFAKWIKN